MSVYLAIFAIALGLLIIISKNFFSGFLSFLGKDIPESGAFELIGYLFIGIGIVSLILMVLAKIYGRKKVEKTLVYLCQYCGDEFYSKEALEKHLERNHPEKVEGRESPNQEPQQ